MTVSERESDLESSDIGIIVTADFGTIAIKTDKKSAYIFCKDNCIVLPHGQES